MQLFACWFEIRNEGSLPARVTEDGRNIQGQTSRDLYVDFATIFFHDSHHHSHPRHHPNFIVPNFVTMSLAIDCNFSILEAAKLALQAYKAWVNRMQALFMEALKEKTCKEVMQAEWTEMVHIVRDSYLFDTTDFHIPG